MLRKAVTVAGLFGAIALLDLLHQPSPDAFNAEAMAIFGFIVLAAYMLGDLAESIHLPHITGYLITGVICGPDVLGLSITVFSKTSNSLTTSLWRSLLSLQAPPSH